MAEYFAGGHLRFVNGEWRDDDGNIIEISRVRYGRWEECDYIEPCVHGFGTIRHTNAGLKCSNCVNVFKKDLLWKRNYCPNCGAKMDGGKNG